MNLLPNQPGKIKLYYFDLYGRAESIRMLLHHADIRLSHSDFKKMKDEGKLEFKMLPVLELPNGKFYSQSQAIKTMLATELGFYPKFTKQTQKSQGNQELEEQKLNQQTSQETTQKSILEGYEIDSILEVNNEICDKYWLMEIEKDPQRLEQDINIYIEIDLRNYFKALNGRIEKLGSSTDIDHYFLYKLFKICIYTELYLFR